MRRLAKFFLTFFPSTPPIRSLERIVGDTRQDVARYYGDKPAPELEPEAIITVATLDMALKAGSLFLYT
jgi:hypothetical protein